MATKHHVWYRNADVFECRCSTLSVHSVKCFRKRVSLICKKLYSHTRTHTMFMFPATEILKLLLKCKYVYYILSAYGSSFI